MISDFQFSQGPSLFKRALRTARNISSLCQRARLAKIPVIFANDNYRKWNSNCENIIQHCQATPHGAKLLQHLRPATYDYFIIKPKHSAFFATPLELLLRSLNTERIILTGMTATQCVLFTANDAIMRDLEVVVPADCVVSASEKEGKIALSLFKLFERVEVIDLGRKLRLP